jgi:hypothetical protein
MRKDDNAHRRLKSPFSESKLEAYLIAGNTIKSCSHGETGGMSAMYKEMINKQINSAKNKRKIK